MSEIEANNSLVAKLAIPVFVLLSVGSLVISVWIGMREAELINPEIYPAFAKIELKAMLYVERNLVNIEEYERCKAVVDQMAPHSVDMSDEEYYKFLTRLGFKLPPLELKNPVSKAQEEKCMVEAERLRKLQIKVLEGQLTKSQKEIEQLIKDTEDKKPTNDQKQ